MSRQDTYFLDIVMLFILFIAVIGVIDYYNKQYMLLLEKEAEINKPMYEQEDCLYNTILSELIIITHPHASTDYVKELSCYICEYQKFFDLNPLKVAAIISAETDFIEQEKTSVYGNGPMQVLAVHAKRHGMEAEELLDYEANIYIGMQVFVMHGRSPFSYNGGNDPQYEERAERYAATVRRRFRRMLRLYRQNYAEDNWYGICTPCS